MYAEGILWQLRRPRDVYARGPMGDYVNRDPAIPPVPAVPADPVGPDGPACSTDHAFVLLQAACVM